MASLLLCSDEPILAEGLTRILSGVDGLSMVACCPAMDDLREQLQLHQPDVLLLDMTANFTFSILSGLQEVASQTSIILWVRSISTELALQAMSLGVRGILRKTLAIDVMLRCLTRVNDGELWFEKALTDCTLSARRYSLTRREGQLISLLSQGLKNREIACALTISEGTVKVYLSRLFQKVGVKDRFELALYGLKNLAPGGGSLENQPTRDARKQDGPFWQPPRSFFVERVPVSLPAGQQPAGQFKF